MPTDFRTLARQKAAKYGLLPDVFVRQIEAESGFNPGVISPAGARGIAQIMPSTAKSWGVNPDDPHAALDAAAKNMASYVRTYGGMGTADPNKVRSAYEKALQAYNAGPGSVGRYLPDETKGYINKIVGPDKFSFTNALQGQSQATPAPQQVSTRQTPGGITYNIYLTGEGEQQAQPLDPTDFLRTLAMQRRGGMSVKDMASAIASAANQSQDFDLS